MKVLPEKFGLIWILKAVIVVFVSLIILTLVFRFIEHKVENNALYSEVESVVSDQLTSPSTAVFPDKHDMNSGLGGKYTVTSYVDSENGFGGTLRIKFVAYVTKLDLAEYRVERINIDGVEVYRYKTEEQIFKEKMDALDVEGERLQAELEALEI